MTIADYIASPIYAERHRMLAKKMAAAPVSLAEVSETLGLPTAVVVDLYNSWQVEKAAAIAVKH